MTAETTTRAAAAPMTHKQILQALSGLYVGIFVAILSSTVVTNVLPTIVADLHAGQSVYTWVITATLLSTTVSSPVWGKLADLVSKKLLIQAGLVIFTAGSVLSGLSSGPGLLDWAGAALLTAAASLLLIWVTLAGDRYAWLSWPSAVMLGGTLLLAVAFVAVERRAEAPVLPLWLFRTRTVVLAITAGLAIGVAL
jgi:MFS family permease